MGDTSIDDELTRAYGDVISLLLMRHKLGRDLIDTVSLDADACRVISEHLSTNKDLLEDAVFLVGLLEQGERPLDWL